MPYQPASTCHPERREGSPWPSRVARQDRRSFAALRMTGERGFVMTGERGFFMAYYYKPGSRCHPERRSRSPERSEGEGYLACRVEPVGGLRSFAALRMTGKRVFFMSN